MVKAKTFIWLVAASLMLTFVQIRPAVAIDWMTGEELIGHCREYLEHPTSLDGVACASYVQGFLGGAEATDKVVADRSSRSGWFERALGTRVQQHIERFGATALAGYCLDPAVPHADVIREVIAYLSDHPEAAASSAQEIVYAALKEFHPCE